VFGRPRADAQLVSDELGRQPLNEKGEDLPLALCQRGAADNVGDGFLFGGERHARAAPFACRVDLDLAAQLSEY
jgi:hypothetical protein